MEPKSVIHSKSRMKALQEYEETHGSKTELKKKRVSDEGDDRGGAGTGLVDGRVQAAAPNQKIDPFIQQIRQAIIDERTDRVPGDGDKVKPPSASQRPKRTPKEGDSYAKEDLREWGSYEENF